MSSSHPIIYLVTLEELPVSVTGGSNLFGVTGMKMGNFVATKVS